MHGEREPRMLLPCRVSHEQGVHIVADAVAEVVANSAYSIEPGDQGIAIAGR
jgi:hypothetical protein